jgi:hypothetical protein
MSSKKKGGTGGTAPGSASVSSAPANNGSAYKAQEGLPVSLQSHPMIKMFITSDDGFSLTLTTSETATAASVCEDFCSMRRHLQPLEVPDVHPADCTLAFPTMVRKAKGHPTQYEYLGQNAVLSSVCVYRSPSGAASNASKRCVRCACKSAALLLLCCSAALLLLLLLCCSVVLLCCSVAPAPASIAAPATPAPASAALAAPSPH